MLGNDFYKVEVNCELSNERLKSLIFFYGPLIGNDALVLYQYLILTGSTDTFNELNELLRSLNVSVDQFERNCKKLNEYKLLKTLKKRNNYIFILNEPLSMKKFIRDDILVRHFIMKAGGDTFKSIVSKVMQNNSYEDYENVSETLHIEDLQSWSSADETYLRTVSNQNDTYSFDTLFDINNFLKGMSKNLFPLQLRTKDNLLKIAKMADLYNIPNDKMRVYIPKVCDLKSDKIDFDLLASMCRRSKNNQDVVKDGYDVPVVSFLNRIQNGKKVTETDKIMIRKLSDEYELNTSVINALLEFIVNKYDNTIIPSKVYSYANNLHKNDIKNAKAAIDWLNKSNSKTKNKKEDIQTVYDTSSNPEFDEARYNEIMSTRRKK